MKLEIKGFGAGTEQAYYSGNIIEDKNGNLLNDGTDNQFGRIYTLDSGSSEPTYEVFPDEPFFPSYATIHTAKDAYKSVLSDVGCNLPLWMNTINESCVKHWKGLIHMSEAKQGKKA